MPIPHERHFSLSPGKHLGEGIRYDSGALPAVQWGCEPTIGGGMRGTRVVDELGAGGLWLDLSTI